MEYIIITFIFFFALRLVSLSFSIRNEKLLQKKGAKQYGKFNSLLLTLAHIAYYFGALYEAHAKGTDFNAERSFLFRTVRHPNYFLNIMPELVGVALLCNAWITLCIGFPLYLCLLIVRIRQEEDAMKELWSTAG